MNCVLGNVDWCFVATKLFLNWWLLIGFLILTPIFLYFKFKWKIRAWQIKKLNPKHVITAIFLNKEGCISILPMKVEQQKIFNFNEETYTVNKKTINRKYRFNDTVLNLSKNLKQYEKQNKNIDKNNIIRKLKTFSKGKEIKENDMIFEVIKTLEQFERNNEKTNDIIKDTSEKLNTIEEYSINEKGIFHTHHGKRWFWQKSSTGEPYSIYVDGISTPISRDYLLGKTKAVKFDSGVVYELAHQTFLRQFLTDSNKVNWKMVIFFMIGLAVAGFFIYQYKVTGKLI